MADHIKIRNIYYMLSYAYQTLNEAGYKEAAAEEFQNIYDLFASILIRGIGKQIKRGLHRDYTLYLESLSGLRGKIAITDSAKRQTIAHGRLICEFDEFTENTVLNQILKITMIYLCQYGNIKRENKKELHKLLLYFRHMETISPSEIRWDTLRYHKNDATYKMLINVCQLIFKGLLQNEEEGNYKLGLWLNDEQMYHLYERFVLNFYKKEYPQYHPKSTYIDWDISNDMDKTFLPTMRTDISLTYNGKNLIIDTKWYKKTMQTYFDKSTLISGNLYQIYTYVKNKDVEGCGNVAGMLLYAKTDEVVIPDEDYNIGGNRISVKTLDLGKDWAEITKQLNLLCSWLEK